ncbi:MAG: hypothetical protein AAF483_29805, partial [Planctomycetota bacterium]
ILWLSQYSRDPFKSNEFPGPDRFRYRDRNPCMVSKGLVYCAPQDCAEVFALDASQGDLVWSTSADQVPDCVHILGIHGDCLIVSGDRIAWIDRSSGKLRARFPGSNTSTVLNALPTPRGMGRGMIAESKIYWPTQGKIFVFSAEVPVQESEEPLATRPILRGEIDLGVRGRVGGNMVPTESGFILATDSKILAWD